MSNETKITIHEIVDGVIWMQFEYQGKPIYKVPLAQSIRDYLDADADLKNCNPDSVAGERAFKKLSISKALESELLRA